MTPKRLLLFDIDGTLIDTGGAGVHSLRQALREQWGVTSNLEGIEIAGMTDLLIIHQILRQQKLAESEENIATFLELYAQGLARELPLREGRVLPGIDELLARLQERPQNVLALLTGNIERGAKLKLEHYGLWQFFGFGAFADDSHLRNDLGPVAIKRALEKHGIKFASDAIDVIGDTPHDITCGKAIGARTIAVATGNFSRADLARCQPDELVEDFSEVDALIARLGW